MHDAVLDWLMAGDPVIRWQVQRDLLDEPGRVWEAERRKTVETGWGARFLAGVGADHDWPDGRWTGALWTLPILVDCGLPADHPPLLAAAKRFIDRMLTAERAGDPRWLLQRVDLCHLGLWLRTGSYFLGRDERLERVASFLLGVTLADGGFNCQIRSRPKTTRHSSLHTTFNVLEGLREAAQAGNIDRTAFRAAEARALDFALQHHLYRSDKTGTVIDERFTHLTYPSAWHFTVLRGLDYIRATPEIADSRLDDPIAMLQRRRKANGKWIVEKRIAGLVLFDMEKWGGESRWNTLRMLRTTKARDAALRERKVK